jgi:membrane protein YqaA with SNARE-associated domain
MTYLTLFMTALISATLFPLGSEALLIYDIKEGYNIYLLLLFATLGNSLGSVINYYMALKGEEFLLDKKVLSEKHIIKGKFYFDKYGSWIILLSWLPIVGDTITFVAGLLKYDFKKFLILVTISKLSRYLFIVYLV